MTHPKPTLEDWIGDDDEEADGLDEAQMTEDEALLRYGIDKWDLLYPKD